MRKIAAGLSSHCHLLHLAAAAIALLLWVWWLAALADRQWEELERSRRACQEVPECEAQRLAADPARDPAK